MNTRQFKFKNGESVVEKISGFKGVITGTAFYLTGCNTYLVTAKSESEFREPVGLWYDEGRLTSLESCLDENEFTTDENGCDILPNIGRKGK